MFSAKRIFGNLGEDVACKFLVKRGFKVIQRNYLRKCGEIDIVSSKDGITHFVEVKTVKSYDVSRETWDDYRPEDNLHYRKLQRMRRVIQVYLNDNHVSRETEWKFDVVTVLLDREGKKAKVNFLEDIII